jgi:hypothetical protein
MKAVKTSLLIGLPVVAGLAVWFLRSPDEAVRKPRPRTAAEPGVAAPAATPAAESPLPNQPSAVPASPIDAKREANRALLVEGEANRIAAREARYAKLDWDAPRPGPPPPREPVVGKREAAMSAGDKLEQTVHMISTLKRRISHTRARANASDALMLERLEKRVSELNETAQVLQKQQDATGSAAPPAGDTGSSAPDDDSSAGTQG